MARMTIAKLKRTPKVVRDIRLLEKELKNMLETSDGIDHDVILNYRKGYPQPQAIIGFNWREYQRRYRLLCRKRREYDFVAGWIGEIEDLQTQTVFKLRYLDGLSWQRIAQHLGMPHNEDYPRRCVQDAYLKQKGIK